MRTPVTCKNCGIKWLRVQCWGNSPEYNDDIQLICPACNSNWYDVTEDTIQLDKERNNALYL